MPAASRSLPERPDLRFLKLEAKRRLAAGEFATLHEAQASIAREHGLASWAALKQLVGERAEPAGHALSQLRWVITRFRDAESPSWSAPTEPELREHLGEAVLTALPPAQLVATVTGLAPQLRQDLHVLAQTPTSVSVQVADLRVDAATEDQPPHRLTDLRAVPATRPATDARLTTPPSTLLRGPVPAKATEAAVDGFAELGLAGLTLAGSGSSGAVWILNRGWANLERSETLDAHHRWPATGITALVTATAVLRLVGDGRIDLDTPANTYLRTVTLADETISVRELLSHTAGVANPPAPALFAPRVPDLREIIGPVVASAGTRGAAHPSNGGYAVLGQLLADVTGSSYTDAATRLVLAPLAMTSASFPTDAAQPGPDTVTGYALTPEGDLTRVDAAICTIPAAGGLSATADDLLRLATGWSTLLPPPLARDALTPQSPPTPDGHRIGLGWLLNPSGDVAIHAGAGAGMTSTLIVRTREPGVLLSLTNRVTPLDSINAHVLQTWTDRTPEPTTPTRRPPPPAAGAR